MNARAEDRPAERPAAPPLRLVDAAYAVLSRHFAKMTANEPGTRAGEDPECLHDMRVATRRLRAALRTFRPAFPDGRLAGFDAELKRIAAALGGVRDLDVYLERLPEYAAVLPPDERDALSPLEHHLELLRARARRRMLRTLDTRRTRDFVARFGRFLERGPPARSAAAQAATPAVEVAPEQIRLALKRVLEQGRAIPSRNPPPEELHTLRKRVKRLRYTCEFFAKLYGKPLRRFVRATVELQDLLGAHQDACVAGEVLREFAADLPSHRKEAVRTALALGRLVAEQDLAAIRARMRFRKAWRAFDTGRVRRGPPLS